MRRKFAVYLLSLLLAFASAQNQPPPGLPQPPGFPLPPGIPPNPGGVIGLLCTLLGNVSIQIQDWQINFCELNRFFEAYNKNTKLFLQTQYYTMDKVDRPLFQTSWYLGMINENLNALGRDPLPVPTAPTTSPADVYKKALARDWTVEEAEEKAMDAVSKHYSEVFMGLAAVVDAYNKKVEEYYRAIKSKEDTIKGLQERLKQVPPGTAEAEQIIRQIHRLNEAISADMREALAYVEKEAPRINAARAASKQVLTDLDKLTNDIASQNNRLAAAKAAKRVAEEQTQKFIDLIKETNEKVNKLVEEAQNATSTRAAVQILSKGLGQLTQTTVVTQSLLHAALAELAQQNVYTNQQIAQSANLIAKQAAIDIANRSEELQAQISTDMGKLRTLVDNAETLQQAKKVMFDNPCVKIWHLGRCGDWPAPPLITPPREP